MIDYRSRLDPAADARADSARVLLVWAVRGDESARGLPAGAGWCGWGFWDAPGRGVGKYVGKAAPGPGGRAYKPRE